MHIKNFEENEGNQQKKWIFNKVNESQILYAYFFSRFVGLIEQNYNVWESAEAGHVWFYCFKMGNLHKQMCFFPSAPSL